MLYLIKMTGAQVKALYDWVHDDLSMSPVLINTAENDAIYVGQGDARVSIYPDGTIKEHA